MLLMKYTPNFYFILKYLPKVNKLSQWWNYFANNRP